jgi:hypothetical protein
MTLGNCGHLRSRMNLKYRRLSGIILYERRTSHAACLLINFLFQFCEVSEAEEGEHKTGCGKVAVGGKASHPQPTPTTDLPNDIRE